jgi:hypothetical protein
VLASVHIAGCEKQTKERQEISKTYPDIFLRRIERTRDGGKVRVALAVAVVCVISKHKHSFVTRFLVDTMSSC